jgi:hypothetical protein
MQEEVKEIDINDIERLPLESRLFQTLRKNEKTTWMAKLMKSHRFWLLLKLLALFLYFCVGCIYYTKKEGWTVGDTIFFSVGTISTVGNSVSSFQV